IIAGALQLIQHLLRRCQQPRTGLGRNHASPLPVENGAAEPLFELTQAVAERRLGDAQALGGGRQRASLGDRPHQLQVADLQRRFMRNAHDISSNNSFQSWMGRAYSATAVQRKEVTCTRSITSPVPARSPCTLCWKNSARLWS